MTARVVQLPRRTDCVVCDGAMGCEFCPAADPPRRALPPREDRLVVGCEVVLDVRGGRVFLHPRARR